MNDRNLLDRLLPPGGALSGRLFSRLIGASNEDPPLPPGTLIGYWRVGELLGRGGSSMVYLAERADGQFDQQAALKVVRPNQGMSEHFRRERQILAELRHPAIARLIDGGEMEGGRLWFAMEPVFGERIDQFVRSRNLPLMERLALFDAVCEAVAYAHSRLLVHRDIKPANLLVDELGRPRLLDFGIATASDPSEAGKDRAMTVTYASPEQRYGKPITTASDIYQLGLLLRVLILPDGEPCPTLPRAMRPVMRRELVALTAHATEDEPADRYPAVAALRADLAAIRTRRGVSVIGGIRYRAARFVERHAVPTAIAAVGVAALASTGWVAAHRVEIERDQATAAAVRAKATSDFLVSLFSVSDPGENRGEKLTANQILARGAAQLDSRPQRDPVLTATVALEIARVYMELGEYARARNLLTAAIEKARPALPKDSPELSRFFTLRGRAAYFLGDYESAGADFSSAHEAAAELADLEERDAARGVIATQEALLARRRGKFEEAAGLQRQALQLLANTRPANDPDIALAWNYMGLIERDLGNTIAAEAAFERSIEMFRARFGDGHPKVLSPSSNLAELLVLNDASERGEPLLLDVIRQRLVLESGPSIGLAINLDLLSQLRIDQGRNEEAAIIAREADQEYAQILGPEHSYRSFALIHLATAELAMGDGVSALLAFEEALRLRRKAFGPQHPDVANALHNLGRAYNKLGNPSGAETVLAEALTIRESMLPTGHVAVPRTRISLVEALIELRRLEEATEQLTRASAEFSSSRNVTDDDRKDVAKLSERLAQAM